MDLHPDFPIVDNTYQITSEWSIDLASPHNRRIEDGSVVLWQPARTAWIVVWGNELGVSVQEKATWVRKDISKSSYDLKEKTTPNIHLIGYRLDETESGELAHSYNGFAISGESHVQISIYFDSEEDHQEVEQMFFSLKSTAP